MTLWMKVASMCFQNVLKLYVFDLFICVSFFRYNAKNSGATDSGFVDIPEGDEQKLKEALATVGPVSVAIDASQESFQFYHEGVYYDPQCSSENLDHGVSGLCFTNFTFI